MTRDLLLFGRRLFEAVADPNADRRSTENAGSELNEALSRIGVRPGRGIPVSSFEGIRADDLSPHAWLLVLESRSAGEVKIPTAILDEIFWTNAEPSIRFRLVSGGLAQAYDGPIESFERLAGDGSEALPLDGFPATWTRDFLLALPSVPSADGTRESVLAEIGLYLLQDGSSHALALAAAAVTPPESWRANARDILGAFIRSVDQNLTGIGRYFLRAGI